MDSCVLQASLYLRACVFGIVCSVGGVAFHHAMACHTFLGQDPPLLRICIHLEELAHIMHCVLL